MTLPNPPVQWRPTSHATATELAARKPAASGVMSLLRPEGVALPPARRLVVLVPDLDLDDAALARRIWNLAVPNKLSVLYLGLSISASEEPHVRRQLATIAALTRDDWVKVSTRLAGETDWVAALRPLVRKDDLIVCHLEQTVSGWRGPRPLGETLCQILQLPVQLLEGFYAGDPAQAAHPTARLVFWSGAFIILASAFWLQVQISGLPKNWAVTALVALSVVAVCLRIGLWILVFK